jgi:chromosome segregation ATPase
MERSIRAVVTCDINHIVPIEPLLEMEARVTRHREALASTRTEIDELQSSLGSDVPAERLSHFESLIVASNARLARWTAETEDLERGLAGLRVRRAAMEQTTRTAHAEFERLRNRH